MGRLLYLVMIFILLNIFIPIKATTYMMQDAKGDGDLGQTLLACCTDTRAFICGLLY